MSSDSKSVDVKKFDPNMRFAPAPRFQFEWRSPKDKPIELVGFPWFKIDRLYRRMPLNPAVKLPEAVDNLANCTAGAQIRFSSNTRLLALRVELAGPANMCHMPATGQCGFDLYASDGGPLKFLYTTRFDHTKSSYECLLFERMKLQPRHLYFTLHFPINQAVKEVQVGLEAGCKVDAPRPFRLNRPVVFYGTSITHGSCASRPGMIYTNALSRRLNIEVTNLGFGGSGKGEPEVARVIAEIPDPACFVLDYEANTDGLEHLEQTLPEFIRILRARHATVPIVVVSKIPYAQENFNEGPLPARLRCRDFERTMVNERHQAGDSNIHFLDMGDKLGPEFSDGTVDSVHPNDLGFKLMADVFEPLLRELLFK